MKTKTSVEEIAEYEEFVQIIRKELNKNMIDKIICFLFGHKEEYLEGLYLGEWHGWWCERCGKKLRGRYLL